jgi:hypothetical protein
MGEQPLDLRNGRADMAKCALQIVARNVFAG